MVVPDDPLWGAGNTVLFNIVSDVPSLLWVTGFKTEVTLASLPLYIRLAGVFVTSGMRVLAAAVTVVSFSAKDFRLRNDGQVV